MRQEVGGRRGGVVLDETLVLVRSGEMAAARLSVEAPESFLPADIGGKEFLGDDWADVGVADRARGEGVEA